MPTRIRVMFIGCPTLDVSAASHLILAQNTIQDELQFEIVHHWLSPYKIGLRQRNWADLAAHWLERRKRLPFRRTFEERYRASLDFRSAPEFRKSIEKKSWEATCRRVVESYDEWFKSSKEPKFDVAACPTIIVTEAAITGDFISLTNKDIGVVSTALWRMFLPISALDYLLTSIQRLSLRMAFDTGLGSHYPTRGCIWDYVDNQADARYSTTLGFVCDSCARRLRASMGADRFETISNLVRNKWLGSTTEPGSTANVLANVYKYDLSRTTGLSSTFLERAWDSAAAETGRAILEVAKWAAILSCALILASYAPDFLKRIQAIQSGRTTEEQTGTKQLPHPGSAEYFPGGRSL